MLQNIRVSKLYVSPCRHIIASRRYITFIAQNSLQLMNDQQISAAEMRLPCFRLAANRSVFSRPTEFINFLSFYQGCGVGGEVVESELEGILGGVGVGTNFGWSRSRKEFWVESEAEGILGVVGVGVGKNVPTPTSI
jgi:hypothetical protein